MGQKRIEPGRDQEVVMVQGRIPRALHKKLKKWVIDRDGEMTQERAIRLALERLMASVIVED